jgi:hypothetical protein
MPATRELHLSLSIEQKEALLTLRSRGPGALLDQEVLYSLAIAGLIEVNAARRVVLTEQGETACASMTLGLTPDLKMRASEYC